MSGDPQLLGEQSRILASRQTGADARNPLNQNQTVLESFFDQVNLTGIWVMRVQKDGAEYLK
jgi:hypothetical protein